MTNNLPSAATLNSHIVLGAIVGDIIGSPYEFRRIKTKDFPLFSTLTDFTDDSLKKDSRS